MRIRVTALLLCLAAGIVRQAPAQRADLTRALEGAPRLSRFPVTDRQTKAIFESGNLKISPELRLLVEQSASKGLSTTAKGLGIPLEGRMVSVELVAENNTDALRSRVRAAGGRVVAEYNNVVFADVPPSAIESLGARQDVSQIRPQSTYQTRGQSERAAPGGTLAEGVIASKVADLHRRGITGKGVKIGLLDFGFAKYDEVMQAGRVPRPAAQNAFGQQSFDGMGIHGTACAEIIHAMAPDAEIYLALSAPHTGGMIQAAQWLETQGVQIISASVGGHLDPHNGTGLLDQFVDEMSQKTGILWVVAAGNEGSSHWMGTTADRDGDGLIDITGSPNPQFLGIQAGGKQIDVQIVWDSWGANPLEPSTTEDVDACLFKPANGKIESVGCSTLPQQGAGSAPRERIVADVEPGGVYLLALKATHITRAAKIHVVVEGAMRIEPMVKGGSIGSPASSHTALAVGAVDVRNDNLEAYSSNGPTDDERLKPEVSAPDATSTPLYSNGRFHGTSAATPHTAGFAALVKQMNPRIGRERLEQAIEQAVRPKGDPVPNYAFGYGHIDGSKVGSGDGPGGAVNVSDSGMVQLPAAFGGPTPVAVLEKLRQVGSSGPFEVKVVTGKPTYQVGDGIRIGMRTAEDCFYVLLHRDANGHYTPVSPRGAEENRLRAGEKYVLPTDGTVIRVRPPAGREQFILICSKRETPLSGGRAAEIAVSTVTYEVIQ